MYRKRGTLMETMKIRHRISSLFLALIIAVTMFTDIIPGTAISVKAEKVYRVLLWSPYTDTSVANTWRNKIDQYYNEMTDISVSVARKDNIANLSSSDLIGVDLIYIIPVTDSSAPTTMSLLGEGNANVTILRNFINSGGRIIMNGEIPTFCSRFNDVLSTLAEKLGGDFSITDTIDDTHVMTMNPDKASLTEGCESIYPRSFAVIEITGENAVPVMNGSKGAFVVDQEVGKGYITAISDGNWIYHESATTANISAAKTFLKNILVDSASHIETVSSPTITGPLSLEWNKGDSTARVLSVTATAETIGTFTYQWHKGTSASFEVSESTKISGANSADYTIPNPETMDVGKYYYRCVVTNTIGSTSVSATSGVATVEVKSIVPGSPTITGPSDLEWNEGDSTERVLSVTATAELVGTFTYQWYKGTSAGFEVSESTKISGANSARYTISNPETMAVGLYYYRCVVTNTIGSASVSATSGTATVEVKRIVPSSPTITGPLNLEWNKGDSTGRVLSVTATAETIGTLTYQWHKGTSAGFEVSESTKISGANSASYTIPNPETMAVGLYYYRCVVTNTIRSANVSATSGTATAEVKYVAPPEPEPEPTPTPAPTPEPEPAPEPIVEGLVEVDVDKSDDTPDISVRGLTEEVATSVATDEEKDKIDKGANAKLWLEITNIDNTVSEEDKQLVSNQAKVLNNAKIGMYMDFSMFFKLDGGDKRKITDLNGKRIKVAVSVPENLRATGLKKRTFYLISIHDGVLRIHGSTTSDVINASVYDFSTYAIIYADEEEEVFEANITIKQTNEKIIVNWDKVTDVGKVDVYVAYCGTKYPKKPTKTTKSRKVTITSLKGKRLNQKKNYKMYLIAYDSAGNRIGKTLSCHFAGKNCKYTNPKKLKLSTKKLTVKVGQSAKIKASIKYEDKKKKPLSEKHAARYRYVSDVPEIVAVDKTGKVTGISPGTCDVYVCLQNGMSKHVSVTVTE